MPLYQCGFVASGKADHQTSNDIASATPVPVPAKDLIHAYNGGWGFALAGTGSGALYTWGVNAATLLGKQGSADDGADPSALDEVAAGTVTHAAAGFDHVILATSSAQLRVFGPDFTPAGVKGLHLRDITLAVPVAALAAGEHHSLVLGRDGTVWALGSNAEGQLGTRAAGSASESPLPVLGPAAGVDKPITAIAAGARHSLAVDADGRVLAWGWSIHGQAGGGEPQPSVGTPTEVSGLGPLHCTSVAAGLAHSLALTDAGDVYAWGRNTDGQLGTGGREGAVTPQLVEGIASPVGALAAGARHSLALLLDGSVLAWGYGAFGATGTGVYADCLEPTAVALPEKRRVTAIAGGWWHSLFVLADDA